MNVEMKVLPAFRATDSVAPKPMFDFPLEPIVEALQNRENFRHVDSLANVRFFMSRAPQSVEEIELFQKDLEKMGVVARASAVFFDESSKEASCRLCFMVQPGLGDALAYQSDTPDFVNFSRKWGVSFVQADDVNFSTKFDPLTCG